MIEIQGKYDSAKIFTDNVESEAISQIYKIIVYRDETCDMVMVTLNGDCIKEGNVWDYHDGCNGDADVYGRYRDLEEFIDALEIKYPDATITYTDYIYGE